jgi:hypothetical protein
MRNRRTFHTAMTASRLTLVLGLVSVFEASALDYKKDIQPIFKKHCYECHSEEADKRKAGYVFDKLHIFVNDIGPNGIVVPRTPSESHLMEVLTNDEAAKNHMPPKASLGASDIKKIQSWIEAGAHIIDPAKANASSKMLPKRKWRNREGKEIEASYVKIEGDQVHLRLTNGQVLPYLIEKLSADSQIWVRRSMLAAAGEQSE